MNAIETNVLAFLATLAGVVVFVLIPARIADWLHTRRRCPRCGNMLSGRDQHLPAGAWYSQEFLARFPKLKCVVLMDIRKP